jgi:hypothetical protein
MAKSLLYFTCPDPKCGKAGYVEIENDDGKVVSHCTTHNAPQAMFDKALVSGFEAHCYHCKTKVEFETETITVLKAVKYHPYSRFSKVLRQYVESCDLAGGQDHMKEIAEDDESRSILEREIGRWDAHENPPEWKQRIAGNFLRSFITTWVRTRKKGLSDIDSMATQFSKLMDKQLGIN